ncbi:hypothetical protein [Streptomyces sp. 3211]|uniref:hypothetical protein n=1 Tax=Streptomyces sp. 3211 TaxID=1964449 RepID=UPI0017E9529A
MAARPKSHAYVQERLSGRITTAGDMPIERPATGWWTGRNKPHRKNRARVQAWSPKQIANRIKVDFPDDETMRISHEAIYQASAFRTAERRNASSSCVFGPVAL